MTAQAHHEGAARHVAFAVLTVSDTRTVETDASGALARELLTEAGHEVVKHEIVHDDVLDITNALVAAVDEPRVDAILLTGGTGVAPRDVTPEAVEPLLDKPLPGFGERFRALSYEEVGPHALLSRATAGTCRGKPVFALPGSRPAVGLAVQKLILPVIGHVVKLARE